MTLDHLPLAIRRALQDYAWRLRDALGARLCDIRLFGSWARGTASQESDVDVWVLIDERDALTERTPISLSTAVLLEHEIDISPLIMDIGEWEFLHARERRIALDIESEGIAL